MYRLPIFVAALVLATSTLSPPPIPRRAGPALAPDSTLVSDIAELLRVVARLPGFSIAAMRDNRVMFARGFGVRNVASGAPVDSSTQFGAASVSKVITATAALRLYQRGVLDLDLPVRRLIPAFPDSTDRITARRLAAHLSGLPHYGPSSMPPGRPYEEALGSLDVFAKAPRIGVPGERYNYSTHGFTLLSAILEAAASQPILTLLDSEVLRPLDMPGTGPMRVDLPTPATTSMYSRTGGELVLMPIHRDYSYSWAGAGLRSTPVDLVRMTRAYFNGFLSDSIVRVAFREQRASDGTPTGVGFGWRVGTDWRGRPIAHHAGVNDGARSVVMMFRDDSSSIAVQTNIRWVSSIESTAMVFAEALFGSDRAGRRTLTTQGRYRGTFAGEPASGSWSIAGDTGSISVPEAFGRLLDGESVRVDRLPVRAIRDGVYALITPWGLYPLRLDERNGQVTGEVSVASRAWHLVSTP